MLSCWVLSILGYFDGTVLKCAILTRFSLRDLYEQRHRLWVDVLPGYTIRRVHLHMSERAECAELLGMK